MQERAGARGMFMAWVTDPDGEVLWYNRFPNLWTTEGKNLLLNSIGATAIGSLYVGLISSTNFVGVNATDTAAQINGSNAWFEAFNSGNPPIYSQGTRPLLTLAGAMNGSRATTSPVVFTITTGGTAQGCFIVTTNTIAGTSGTLITAGVFLSGPKTVANGQNLNVVWTGYL